MSTKQPKPIDTALVTVKQAAEALQVHDRTIHNLIRAGYIESVAIENEPRIPLREVGRVMQRDGELKSIVPRLKHRAQADSIAEMVRAALAVAAVTPAQRRETR